MTDAATQTAVSTTANDGTGNVAPSTQTAPSTPNPAATPVVASGHPSTAAVAPTTAAAPVAAEPVYNLKAPEGFDQGAVARVVELSKLYGIAPDKAQKLLDDTHANQAKAKSEMDAALAKQKADWHAEILADKEIGGEQFKPTMERAQKVINEIDQKIAPGIKKLLDDSGYGDHPNVVRLFAYLGKANREDSFAIGDRSVSDSGPKSLTQLLYPKA